MRKNLLSKILFLLFTLSFILLCFFQVQNSSITATEVIFMNNEYQYVQLSDVYGKMNIDFEKNQITFSAEDINTRLLEDSIETLSYVKNAEVYLSLNNKLTVFIQQEVPFIRTVIDGDTCFFTKDSVKLNLVHGQVPKVLFFIGDIRLQSWGETCYLANYLYDSNFLNSIISKVSYNKASEYILHSDLFDYKINIGTVSKLDKKVEMIKLFFTGIVTHDRLNKKNNTLIKEINVAYEDQIICVN